MGTGQPAAVVILANEACLASRGVSAAEIVDALAKEGLAADWLAMPMDAAGLDALTSQLHARRPAVLVAAGGDGTVHAAANLAVPLGVPLGVIPLGTANDFARGLHLPTALDEAARVIAWEAPMLVDVGLVNQEVFVNAAHLGLGVETARRTDPHLKRWLGPLAYGMAAVKAWHDAEPLVMEICVEDEACVRMLASQLLVGAGMSFGGGHPVGKPAPDSGLLEVVALGGELGPAGALGLVAALKLGTLAEHPQALHVRAARLTVKLSRPAEVNLDGELLELGQELHFELLPGGLGVYAPARAPVTAEEGWGAGMELA